MHISFICHRFLTHLTNTLGPDTFLAPVCMLLVDRVAPKISRQSVNDNSTTLAPGLGLIKHQQASVQLQVGGLLEVTPH